MKKIIIFSILVFTINALAFNQSSSDKFVNVKKIIGPYPTIGSEASNNDFAILHYYQETRTNDECQAAGTEVKANLESFYGELLTDCEISHVKALFTALKIDVGIHAGYAKYSYKRPRPFLTDPTLKPCVKLEKTYAYPSGHSTMAHLYAKVLAHIFPDRAEQFLNRGDEIALNRVIGGVHHPSDIEAGKKLGFALSKEIIKKLNY